MRRTLCLVLVAVATALPVAASDDCLHQDTRQAVLEAAGASRLVVDAAAGALEIHGRAGLGQVRAEGKACASSADLLQSTELVARRDGDTLHVRVEIPETSGAFNRYARLDLVLEVPATLALDVDDSSGETTIDGVAAVRLDDGSGAIHMSSIGGDVTIDDGSGEIVLADVGGDVRIDDGSGEIDLARVGGSIWIDDGSGGIRIRNVGGSVEVGDDGSGSIDVADVRGDFTVRHDGSGGIRYEQVDGRVRIPSD